MIFRRERKKAKILLLVAAVGMLLDALTTIVGIGLGFQEVNPIANIIGTRNLFAISLLVRAAIVIFFWVYIDKANMPKRLKLAVQSAYVMIFMSWLFVVWNAAQIVLILVYYYSIGARLVF